MPRQKLISLGLSPELKDLITQAARAEGMNNSEFIRMVLHRDVTDPANRTRRAHALRALEESGGSEP